jgi:hypothetical protein
MVIKKIEGTSRLLGIIIGTIMITMLLSALFLSCRCNKTTILDMPLEFLFNFTSLITGQSKKEEEDKEGKEGYTNLNNTHYLGDASYVDSEGFKTADFQKMLNEKRIAGPMLFPGMLM